MTSPRPLSGLFWCPIKMSFACSGVNVSSPWNKQNRAFSPWLTNAWCPSRPLMMILSAEIWQVDKWLLGFLVSCHPSLISGSYRHYFRLIVCITRGNGKWYQGTNSLFEVFGLSNPPQQSRQDLSEAPTCSLIPGVPCSHKCQQIARACQPQ